MNYLDNEQKQKMEKIVNLQNSIEASKERQEERNASYDDYLINTKSNKAEEELKMKKMLLLKRQRDKKKKLEKRMNDWAHKQEKISEEKIKEYEKNKNNNNKNNDSNKEENENEENNNNYNEKFDISKYTVISLDNMKNNNDDDNKDNINNTKNEENIINKINMDKEIICLICQRKFASAEKLALHEKISALHKQNLDKLKLNNN